MTIIPPPPTETPHGYVAPPTAMPTATATPVPTSTPTVTLTPSPTPTPIVTPTGTLVPTVLVGEAPAAVGDPAGGWVVVGFLLLLALTWRWGR